MEHSQGRLRRIALLTLAAASVISGVTVSQTLAAVLDLTSGGSGTVNGAQFFTLENQNVSTGTGVFDPFLRIQANGVEQGYNTDRGAVQFDEKTGSWTHSIQLQDIPVVNGFLQFTLDLGEPTSKNLISLDQAHLFYTDDSDIHGATYNGSDFGTNATKVWDLDGAGDSRVELDYNLIGSGNGRADLLMYVLGSAFSGASATDYVVLYTRMGDTNPADGTFEEWAFISNQEVPSPVPIPAALPLFASALLGFGLFRFRMHKTRAS